MEVHHHPEVERKNFKEYFLEFLMIFLAVTMGFFAENIREHISEQRNARVLSQSLFEDMKKDTASLHFLIEFRKKKINAIDSLLLTAHSPRNKWNARRFYANLIPIFSSYQFRTTDGTYSQMKTSGTLRYLNQPLVNIINAYYVQNEKTKYRDEIEDKGTWIFVDFNFNVMNLEAITDIRFNLPATHELYIKIAKKDSTDKFINLVALIKGFCFRSLQEYQEQLKIGNKLIEALKKDYDLEN